MKKDLLTLSNLTREDFEHLFARARDLKQRHKEGITDRMLAGKSLGLLFEKASTRTRISFETAMIQLGGVPIFMSAQDLQLSRNEPIKDTARVLSRYVDALAIRTYSQAVVEEFAQYTDIPVINALTDKYHPCQVLSDLMTVIESKGGYQGLKIAWMGDGNNVAQSWINAAAILGFDLTLGCPPDYFPDQDILEAAKAAASTEINILADPEKAVAGADVIYTDVWASMGQEDEQQKREKVFAPYQVNDGLVSKAAADAIVMHCLPAHRGEEISDAVMEGPQSVIWDQSENKLHMHKAILEALMS